MSPVVKAKTATLANILKTLSELSGGTNGPIVTDFDDINVNMISASLPGPYKTGVTTLSITDYEHYGFPLCDVGDDLIPHEMCNRPRGIMTSLFYPACLPTTDNQPKAVLLNEQYFAPVFSPSILSNISHNLAGGSTALHNLMSQAVTRAPACEGNYPMTIFAPAAGGQRQAYTQVASELASLGHVVITVDHSYVSGAVEQDSEGGAYLGLFGEWINTTEALSIQTHDVRYVHNRLVTEQQPLSSLPFWTENTTVQLDACVFGHGSGGEVAQMMVNSNVVECGGALEGVLTLPAPFNREDPVASPTPIVNNTVPTGSHVLSDEDFLLYALPTPHRLLDFLKDLRSGAMHTISQFACRITGTCKLKKLLQGTTVQRRSVGDDPWYPPKETCHKQPCDEHDYDYNDDDDDNEHVHCGLKGDTDCDDHYEGQHHHCDNPCDNPCDSYIDPCNPCEGPHYKRPKPYPPPGVFPPNSSYGDDKTRPDDRPWEDHWDDYRNDGGDVGRKYNGDDCDNKLPCDEHYDGDYEGDDDPDYHGDIHDHYREWDRKHHRHGYVNDHDEDNKYKDDYAHEDDYGGDEFNYGDQDDLHHVHDHDAYGDSDKKHHHHGHVDGHDKDDEPGYKDDYGGDEFNYGDQDDQDHKHDKSDDHGHVDEWHDQGEYWRL